MPNEFLDAEAEMTTKQSCPTVGCDLYLVAHPLSRAPSCPNHGYYEIVYNDVTQTYDVVWTSI